MTIIKLKCVVCFMNLAYIYTYSVCVCALYNLERQFFHEGTYTVIDNGK